MKIKTISVSIDCSKMRQEEIKLFFNAFISQERLRQFDGMVKFVVKLPAKKSSTASAADCRSDSSCLVNPAQKSSVGQIPGDPSFDKDSLCVADPVEGSSTATASQTVSTKRRFLQGWMTSFPWISYDKTNDAVLCSTCREIFHTMGLPFSTKKETIFIETGFKNWKKAIEKFKLHEKSMCHREAVVKMHALKSSVDVSAQLSDQRKKEMMLNRTCLKKIFSSVLYLACQGLAIRGHNDDASNFTNFFAIA